MLTHKLVNYGIVEATMNFKSEADYDNNIGTIVVTDLCGCIPYRVEFKGVGQRNQAIANTLRESAGVVETFIANTTN